MLCAEVDRIRTEANTRLAIALPPRSLKSIIISVALPAWLLGHNPGIEIVCASYGQVLGDELSAKCRQVMLAPWYRRLFPETRLVRGAVGNLVTTANGKRFATSIGGALTGMGADVILVDDPMKPDEAVSDAERSRINDWVSHTLFTRTNHKMDERMVVVHQRLHENDMIGHVMENGGFEPLFFPAIAQKDEEHIVRLPFGTLTYCRKEGEALHPEREPLETLEKQRKDMGSAMFDAQYLQMPTRPEGGLLKIAWFQFYDPARKPQFCHVVQSWDCGSKTGKRNDYSVCTTWGVTSDRKAYLLNVFRERLEYPDLKLKVRELAACHNAKIVLIEDAANGIPLIQELSQELPCIKPIVPSGDKSSRVYELTGKLEAGMVWVPEGRLAWLDEFLREMARFPLSQYDDQVDSMSQAIRFIAKGLTSDVLVEGLGRMVQVQQSFPAAAASSSWLNRHLGLG